MLQNMSENYSIYTEHNRNLSFCNLDYFMNTSQVKHYKLLYSCVTLLLVIETVNKTPRAMYLKKLQLTSLLVNYRVTHRNENF